MPLQNRVDPFGAILAMPERGTLMGNRGGRIHDASQRIGGRRWTSRRWIACELAYKGWRRPVMGEGYTELFFLDEVTALAAGHRPCFFCRRRDAQSFAAHFAAALGGAADADAIDVVLHRQRLAGTAKRHHAMPAGALPDGAVFAAGGVAYAMHGAACLRWTPGGWTEGGSRPTGSVAVLTPPAIVAVMTNGYRPRWHGSTQAITRTEPPKFAC